MYEKIGMNFNASCFREVLVNCIPTANEVCINRFMLKWHDLNV